VLDDIGGRGGVMAKKSKKQQAQEALAEETTDVELDAEYVAYQAWLKSWNKFCDEFRAAAEAVDACAAAMREAIKLADLASNRLSKAVDSLDEERSARVEWSTRIKAMTLEE
jgi:hypothetical protein